MEFYSEIDFLSASPVEVGGACTVQPIFLQTFKGKGAGAKYQEYRQHLSLHTMTKEDLADSFSEIGVLDKLSQDELASVTQYDFLTLIPFLREHFESSLSYFISESVLWNQSSYAFQCFNDEGICVGEINRETYPSVRRAILKSNYISVEEEPEDMAFSGARSLSIFEKLRAGRKRKKAAVSASGPSFADVISSVSVRSNAYTLLNIWDLSIYQLLDQFSRINTNFQVDVIGSRWAAWGTEPFDFTLWYKKNEEEK